MAPHPRLRPRRSPTTLIALGALLIHLALALAPQIDQFNLPQASRLLYLHVPLVAGAYAAWLWALGAGARHVTTGLADAAVARACGAGAALALGNLLSGLVWSQEFLRYTPWTDPKVIATAVLVAHLAGVFLSFRLGAAPRVPTLLAFVGLLTVPASYFASRASAHPPEGFVLTGGLAPELVPWFVAAVAGGVLLGLGMAIRGGATRVR